MNDSLVKKLRGYSLLAGGALLPAAADGQIIYTDVIPDTTTNYIHSYNLDLNNDGAADFELGEHYMVTHWTSYAHGGTHHYSSSWFVSADIKNKGNNSFQSFSYFPAALQLNDTINSGKPFKKGNGVFIRASSTSYSYTPWHSANDAYVGLKLVKGSSSYYGWARLLGGYKIYDYAYNTIPNQFILAGDKGCINPPVVQQPTQAEDTLRSGVNGKIQWYRDGAVIPGANASDYALTKEGNYAYTLTDGSGCTSMSGAFKFIPCYLVKPQIKSNVPDLVLCEDEVIWFSLDDLPDYFIKKFYVGSTRTALSRIEYSPYFGGDYCYFICYLPNSDCIVFSDSLFVSMCPNGIDEVASLGDEVLIFNNSIGTEIHFTSTQFEGGSLVVLNELGQEVLTKTIHGNITLDNQQFTAGIYFAVIRKEEKQVVKKLLIGTR